MPEPILLDPNPYEPFPRQIVFHTCPAMEVLFGGAAGPGKTAALCQEAHQVCLEQPGTAAVIFRRIYPQLNEQNGVIATVRGLMAEPAIGIYHETTHEARYANGSVLALRHAQDYKAVLAFKGAQWQWLGVDEAGDWSEREVRFLKTRVRSANPAIPIRIRYTANPIGIGFEWLKRTFVQPCYDGRAREDVLWQPPPETHNPHPMTRCYIPATHSDNPALDAGYYGRLAGVGDERTRIALLTGSWDLPADEHALFQPSVLRELHRDAVGAQGPQAGHRYLHVWDLARRRDWTVGITLDVTQTPFQIVAFERFRLVPWPVVADRLRMRHAAYSTPTTSSRTVYDSTGVGDPVGEFLDIPLGQAQGFTFTAKTKPDAVQALILMAERGAVRGPSTGMQGIEELWAEMALYRWEDKALVQDCVMALAMAAHDQRSAVAELRRVVPVKPKELPRPLYMEPSLASPGGGWMGG